MKLVARTRTGRLWIRRIAVAFSMTVFSLLLAEVVVRVAVPVRNVGPSFTAFDPDYGKRLKKSFFCVRKAPEFTMRFTTNELGYRGPALAEPDPILFLGDSFTLGYGVDDGQEYPQLVAVRLASMGSKVPVLNAGIGGVGNGHWVKFLDRATEPLAPRLVVLQLCGNDFEDNLRESLFALDDQGALSPLAQAPAPGLARHVQTLVESVPGLAYCHLVCLARQALQSGDGIPPVMPAVARGQAPTPAACVPGAQLTLALVERALSICKQRKWPVMGITVSTTADQQALVRRLFSSADAPLIEAPDKAVRPDMYFVIDGHWNVHGHAEIARMLVELLTTPPWRELLKQ